MVSIDRGSATLSVAGACVALAMAGGIAIVAGFGVIQAQRSQDTVDLAALAAAEPRGDSGAHPRIVHAG
jgi:hypothetical protein